MHACMHVYNNIRNSNNYNIACTCVRTCVHNYVRICNVHNDLMYVK